MSMCKERENWCTSNDPCFHTIFGWEHMWLYWILRRWGLPREIVSIILGNHKKSYWRLDPCSIGFRSQLQYEKITYPYTTKIFRKAMNFKYSKYIRKNNILLLREPYSASDDK